MLNQRGGHELFGFSQDGNISGQNVSVLTIERNPVDHGLEVISIQVEKGIAGPYTY